MELTRAIFCLKEMCCPLCGKLLGMGDVKVGKVQLHCPRCKRRVVFLRTGTKVTPFSKREETER